MAEHPTEKTIPLVLSVIGLILYAVAAIVHAGGGAIGPVLIAAVILGAVQTILLILAAMVTAAILRISFGDFGTAVLKFIGISLLCGATASLLPWGGLLSSFLFLALVIWLFELEVPYAVALAIVYFVVNLLAAMLLQAVLK